MKVIKCSSYAEVSCKAADILEEQVRAKPDSVLGLATGETPLGMYREVISRHQNQGLDFGKVTTFNLDEYYPIKRSDDQSYYYFMFKNLFDHVNIKPENIHIPSGEAPDASKECDEYEARLEEQGWVDLQVLGIGPNGHIAFNEPAEKLSARTHLVGLTKSTIEANSRFFASEDDVPKQALTMGIGTIMKAKKIIILACGEKKRPAVEAMLSGMITTDIPASVLNAHRDVTLITDIDL